MTPVFADLPVALPAGSVGVRIDVASVSTMMDESGSARRAEFLAGRLAAAESMRRLGVEPEGVLGRTSDGAPAWPEGLTGSISHHSGVACAVVSADARGIGVDVAPVLSESQTRAVTRRCLVEVERDRWMSPHHVALAFGAKESIYKAAYPQVSRYVGFDEAEVVDQAAGTWTARLGERLSGELGVGWVSGSYAWEADLVYVVLALDG